MVSARALAGRAFRLTAPDRMRFAPALFALALSASSLEAQDAPLSVLRHTPGDTARSSNIVSVTFDRPVAGRLDATIEASRIFHIEPAIAGRVEWRDPITIRFVPEAPLAPGAQFTVSLDTTFTAIDGSRLERPYSFTFRVRGPQLLARSFGGEYPSSESALELDGKVRLLYSAPVDLQWLSQGVRLELQACAGGVRRIALRATRQRPIAKDDPYQFRYAGGWGRDTSGDRFRRVVEMEPVEQLPMDCHGFIVLPTTSDDGQYGPEERFVVATARSFRILPLECDRLWRCSLDGIVLNFTAPVTREEVQRHVHLTPAVPLDIEAQGGRSESWRLKLHLAPRATYAVIADKALRDVNGRALVGPRRMQVVTGDYQPAIGHATGSVTIPRSGSRTLPLRHVNVRTARIVSYIFPESARPRILAAAPFGVDTSLLVLAGRPETTLVTLKAPFNVERTTEIPLPARLVNEGSGLAVLAIDVTENIPSPEAEAAARSGSRRPIVIRSYWYDLDYRRFVTVQLSDLAVHAKAGTQGGMALVTGLADGRSRAGVAVRELDADGNTVARGVTGQDGIAELHPTMAPTSDGFRREGPIPIRNKAETVLIEAALAGDRIVTPLVIRSLRYQPQEPLEPSRLGGRSEILPTMAATLFADRGIYRPGEMLYLTGVLREGTLHTLKAPTRGDSVRFTLRYHPNGWDSDEDVVVRDTVLRMTEFGTVCDSSRLRAGLTLGRYVAELSYKGRKVAQEELSVAEYRAPEFLVEARADSTPRFGGDTVRVNVGGRYLFGAPMGRARVSWSAVLHEVEPWEIRIPGAEGWTVGESAWWGANDERQAPAREVGGADSLDDRGRLEIHVPLDSLRPSRPGRVDVSVGVTDINRQAVTSSTSVAVHPARLYVLARKQSHDWYWSVGKRATVEIRTVRPDGRGLTGVPVVVSLLRREWHFESWGRWIETPVRTDTVRSGKAPVPYSFVPMVGGIYELRLSAMDGLGGVARTTLSAYAIAGGSRWWAQSPYHLPLVTERRELAVGDSTRVLFDSPFDLAEAWVTLEREGIIERRRMVVRRGPNVVPIRAAEAHVPNVFVSVLLVRRTDAGVAARPDSASQLVRAGYLELKVKTDRKRLAVAVAPVKREYGPGDTAIVRVRVSDAAGRPARGEVTLWAVDEGILALTGYATPDIVARLYQPRGLGTRLASTLPSILTAKPALDLSLDRTVSLRALASSQLSALVVASSPGATPAASVAAPVSLRSQFRSTAFFLAVSATDSDGRAEFHAKLPDNLTTYRVMAVAIGAGDRFGSGDTTLLVTRPLVARPTLPRFVRESDTLLAGAVVNVRDGAARQATVEAGAEGITLQGATRRTIDLARGRGAEARFGFVMPSRDHAPDSVVVRLRASDGASGDAVETRLPVRHDFHPRMHTEIGVVRGSTEVVMDLPRDIDAARSRLTVRIGTAPLAPMLAAYDWLRVYPYNCTEQIASGGRALLAIWRATRDRDSTALGGDPRPHLQALADELVRRLRSDGAVRYWGDHEWSTPWLTTYAGLYLLEAREQGISVDSAVLGRIARYLTSAAKAPIDIGGMNRYQRRARRLSLGGRVATVEFLRRFGHPDEKAEDRLLALAPLMTWEDRVRLAEALAPRHDARSVALLDAAWTTVTRAGNRVDLPDSAFSEREFPSRVAPAARLLTATLALRPEHPLLGGLVETVMQQGRAEGRWAWNSQDYSSVVLALASLQGEDAAPREVRVERLGRTLLARRVGSADSASSLPLDTLLERAPDGRTRLRLTLASDKARAPVYYAVSVDEVPTAAPVTPDIRGIVVERWYERLSDGRPVTSVQEGELVRVRLRLTVPSERQFVAVEDPLPAGLEAVDLSLRTIGTLQPFASAASVAAWAYHDRDDNGPGWQSWLYGRWDDDGWSPWEHKAMHDDKVVYFARVLWKGSYSASYVARATTAGSFVRPPAHAEEMYNPALQGRSDGGRFHVVEKQP